MSAYKTLKEEAWEANMDLIKNGLVILTFGNVSALDPKGVIAIKPSGVRFDVLRPVDMVVVDLENQIVEGKLNPSSDTPTHTLLYRTFKSIGGVAHTHSTYATAWAQAQKSIPILGTTHADYLNRNIPCTPLMTDEAVQNDYEEQTGLLIIQTLQELNADETQMILVARHGPFTWGANAREAVQQSVVLEELAKTAFLTLSIDPDIPALKDSLIQKHFRRKHGKDAYYGQKDKNI